MVDLKKELSRIENKSGHKIEIEDDRNGNSQTFWAHYIDFVKHHCDHLQTYYPRPTKTTLDLYGKLIVEAHPEFKDRIHSTKKAVLPWVNKASFNIVC